MAEFREGFAIDSDAHSTGHLGYLRYRVSTARRGWLTAEDVITSWTPPRLREFLRKARGTGPDTDSTLVEYVAQS